MTTGSATEIALPASDAPVPSVSERESSALYRQILKSSALIGTSSLMNVVVGIARTKILAVLLGPASFGLMGAYLSLVDLGRTVAQLGVNASGVRQISHSAALGDDTGTAKTYAAVWRVALATAILGGLTFLVFAPGIARVTFGSSAQAGDVALLSLAIFFGVIAGGQTALLQGMRRIPDMAGLSFFGALTGSIATVCLVYAFREAALAMSLVAAGVASVVVGWLYTRRIVLPRARLTAADTLGQASDLLKLGLAFMGSGLLTLGAAYLVRIIVLRDAGLEAAGFYQAAWTLGGLYVTFILQAMGADFYPLLVSRITHRDEANRLVNQQTKVSLLLAGPGVIATLALAPIVVQVLYSGKFAASVETLRWICLGMSLRVITWPIGYIVVARGRQTLFFATELAWSVFNVGATLVCVNFFGVAGAGIAFFASYVFHGLMLYPIVRHVNAFRWSGENLKIGGALIVFAGATFLLTRSLPLWPGTALGAALCVGWTIYSVRELAVAADTLRLPPAIARLFKIRRSA